MPKKFRVKESTALKIRTKAGLITLITVSVIGLSLMIANLMKIAPTVGRDLAAASTPPPVIKPDCKNLSAEQQDGIMNACNAIGTCESSGDGPCTAEYDGCVKAYVSACATLWPNNDVPTCMTVMECVSLFQESLPPGVQGICVKRGDLSSLIESNFISRNECAIVPPDLLWCAGLFDFEECNCKNGGPRFIDPTLRPLIAQYSVRKNQLDCIFLPDLVASYTCSRQMDLLEGLQCIENPCPRPSRPGSTGGKSIQGGNPLYSLTVGGKTITGTKDFVEKAARTLDSMAIANGNCNPLPAGCDFGFSYDPENPGPHSQGKAMDLQCCHLNNNKPCDPNNINLMNQIISGVNSAGLLTPVRECTAAEQAKYETIKCPGGMVHIQL